MKSYRGIKPDIQELLNYRYQAKALKLFTNGRMNNVNAGSNMSNVKGRGMDFDEVRHYCAGDDIRLMHWALTARLGKPYTKVYREEKERSFYFILDQSSSMNFGTRECFKAVKATNFLALMGFSALEAQEKVGGIIFDDKGYNFYPAKQDKSSLIKMFNFTTTEDKNYQTNTNKGLSEVLKSLYTKITSGSVVITISDFSKFDDNSHRYLKLLAKRNKILNIFSYDPIEKGLPALDRYYFSNGEEKLVLDSADKKQHQLYKKLYDNRKATIKDISRQYKMGFIEIATNDDLVKTINYRISGYAK